MTTFPADHMARISKEIIAFSEIEHGRRQYRGSLAAHFECWTGNDLIKERELIEELCKYIAIEYHQKRMKFEECDVIVNALFAYEMLFMGGRIIPPILWSVYEAFDAGEWHRKADKSDDPVAEYTDTAIAEIVASL